MSAGGDSLTVTIGGKDVGLVALLDKVDKEMQQSADSAVKLGQSYARLAVAQGKPAAASQILAGTIGQAGAASEKALIGIETQAARTASGGLAVLPRTLAGLSHEAAAFATASLGFGAAVGVAAAAVHSFAEAFTFKAQLDATTLAVNAQIKGVRDSGQVWSEAAKFANDFKLTQQETTAAVQASIGVMRNSKASVEDILGVLARMQVLSPEQSLEEAAIALKSLAAGDTTSLVTRFEVSRDVANQMKQEIQGGADAVAVMSKFLGDTGIGMDVLATKTQGASGAMKDLARAQEELKIAQAGFAQGPGIAILDTATKALTATTRILTGDTASLTQSLFASIAAHDAQQDAMLRGATAAEQAAAAELAYATAIGTNIGMTQQNTDRTKDDTSALDEHHAALIASGTALVDETTKKLDSAQAAQQLAAFQQTLASLGGAVAGGLQTAGAAAAQLASQYNIATGAALNLINAQAALAQAKVNAAALVEQRAGERGPGASGVQEAANQEQARLNAIYKKLVVPEPKARKARGGGGGTPGVSKVKLTDQQKLNNSLLADQEQYETKSEDAATQHAIAVEKINQDFYEKMSAARQEFDLSQLEGRASFYDTMGGIESQAIQQQASQAYEAASIEAGKIATEKGADVAEKYMDAQEQIITSRAKRLSDIEKAVKDKDKGRAEYLRGVDAEYKKAEDAKLARIQEGGGSIEAERQKQLDDAAAKEADAQDKLGVAADRAAERKIAASERAGKIIDVEKLGVDSLTASYNALGAAGSRAGVTPGAVPPSGPGTPVAAGTPVVATAAAAAPAADPVVAALDAIRAAVDAAANAIVGAEKDTGSAVRGLSGKFAS